MAQSAAIEGDVVAARTFFVHEPAAFERRSKQEDAVSDFRSILVHVSADKACEPRVACAADIARRFDARLIGLGSEMIPLHTGDPLSLTSGDLMTMMVERVDERLAQAQVAFERLALGCDRRWIGQRILPDEAVNQAARSADLIVTGRPPAGGDASRHEDPGLLVVISGRPVLVAPPKADRLSAERVMVWFKDTRESRRAMADAMPFLRRAAEVLVVEVAPRAELAQACARVSEIAEHLARHGVNVRGEAMIQDERRTANILLDRADSFSADLIVSGGYGRSRLGEWAFGGVTRTLLEQDERFVLLSH